MGVISVAGIRNGEEWGHTINVINTTQGIVYIEPQNDEIWWYDNYEPIEIGKTYNLGWAGPMLVTDYRLSVTYEGGQFRYPRIMNYEIGAQYGE